MADLTGYLKINNVDAWTTYGIGLSQGSLFTLVAPPPMKAYISNESRQNHGKDYITSYAKMDERTFTISMFCVAPSGKTIYECVQNLVTNVLINGQFTIQAKGFGKQTVLYKSMSGTNEYNDELATFTLTLVEPNPYNRPTT